MLDLSPDPIVTYVYNRYKSEVTTTSGCLGHLMGAHGAYSLVGDVRVVAICKRGCSTVAL